MSTAKLTLASRVQTVFTLRIESNTVKLYGWLRRASEIMASRNLPTIVTELGTCRCLSLLTVK